MAPLPALLAALPTYPKVGESIAFQLTGLVVVFCALGSIWVLMEAMGFIFRRFTAPITAKAPAPPSAPAPVAAATFAASAATPAPSAFDPVIGAVIAAAVHHSLEGRHRVLSITPLATPADWSREGRRDIFTSHRVR